MALGVKVEGEGSTHGGGAAESGELEEDAVVMAVHLNWKMTAVVEEVD